MLRLDLVPALIIFAALLLAAALLALSASGHFPRHDDTRDDPGAIALYLSMLAGGAAAATGLIAAWRDLPWPPAVIAGGLAVLMAPLVLQNFPDRFVDGRGSLAVFGGGAVVLAAILLMLTP
ncbi:MAG: hypothetical protein ACTHLO_00780 [Pseudolabrys sp.]